MISFPKKRTNTTIIPGIRRTTVFLNVDSSCTKKLKNHKCARKDNLINEYFSEFSDIILPILVDFFNKIFESGIFRAPWSKAVIIPLHKKGNTNDPGNYRGISITSSLGKLFTSKVLVFRKGGSCKLS